MTSRPLTKPNNPKFSSGPCSKRPGWSFEEIAKIALLGKSHRSSDCKNQIKQVIDKSKELLKLPAGYVLGIVPGSDTGAFEMAMWSFLGPKPVDAVGFESFSSGWIGDIKNQLKIENLKEHKADYGLLPDLTKIDSNNDLVFTYNGTTSGVRVPNLDFIKDDRAGVVLCDATSAVFSMDIEWQKIDIATYSWQKVMGGEAAHGVIILSPKAIARLESNPPTRPIPKIFNLLKKGKLNTGIFEGSTINTPSMLCIADALDALTWMESIGGLNATIARSNSSLQTIKDWITDNPRYAFLSQRDDTISCTSVCLKITGNKYNSFSTDGQKSFSKKIAKLLETEGVAYDIGSYRDAPSGIRIWTGTTIEAADVAKLLPWLDYAYDTL